MLPLKMQTIKFLFLYMKNYELDDTANVSDDVVYVAYFVKSIGFRELLT